MPDAAQSKLRLVVLFGGASAEHDISCITAAHVLAAADRSRYELVPVGITRDGTWVAPTTALAALAADEPLGNSLAPEGPAVEPLTVLRGEPGEHTVVLPLLHGPHGEDGTIQGMLELFGLAYVGSGVLGSALCMDKAMAKNAAAYLGIPQCRWIEHRDGFDDEKQTITNTVDTLGLPVFVKPANMGSSVGITKAHDEAELAVALQTALAYDDVLVIEEGITAREIEVAVLGNSSPEASLPGEILPGAGVLRLRGQVRHRQRRIADPGGAPRGSGRRGSRTGRPQLSRAALPGLARVDFFYEESHRGGPGRGWLLNEINTIPGFTPASMYPKMWEASGLKYSALIDRLVSLAQEVHAKRSAFSTAR